MTMRPDQPQTIGGVLDTTFRLYKASLLQLIPLSLLMTVAAVAPSIYVLMHANPADPTAQVHILMSAGYWITYGVSLIGIMWATGALYLKTHAIGSGEALTTGSALQKSLTRLPTQIGATILWSLMVGVGLLLLLVPGLILMGSLILTFNLAVIESKGPLDSVVGSHRLIWGHWWRTAAILTVGIIIVIVLYMVAIMAITLLAPLFASVGALMVTMVASIAVGGLMGLLLTPFYISMLIALYWDLKLRKEGTDLAARVGALTAA